MKLLKRIFVTLLILLTFNLCLPNMPLADQDLTEQPQIRSTPEEDIPPIKVKKVSRWTWVIVVGLLGGMLVAASAGGGGDSGGGSSGGGGGDGGDSGDSTVTW